MSPAQRALALLAALAPTARADAVAPQQCATRAAVDCAGSDLGGGGVVPSAAACCERCAAHPSCAAFTWHGPGGSPAGFCSLKRGCTALGRAGDGTVSGVLNGSLPPLRSDPHCNHGHSGPSPAPPTQPLPRVRPHPSQRAFVSPALEAHLAQLMNRTWREPQLATLLWNCLPNTLDTTVWGAPAGSGVQPPAAPNPLSFVSTGDQASMYLRDSQNQVLPYLRYAKAEPDGIGAFLRGILGRYVHSVLLDPYANSFDYSAADKRCHMDNWLLDNSTMRDAASGRRVDAMKDGVHQRKWEMDSLCSVLKLGRLYYEATADARPFGGHWRKAVALILRTFREQQRPLDPSNFTQVNYTFQTLTHEPKDTSAHGIGRNHRWTGMIRTSFLPSDDSPRLPYFIPGNAFAVVELRATAALLRNLSARGVLDGEEPLAKECEDLAREVDAGIQRWGVIPRQTDDGGLVRVYSMEVDGFGNSFFGDDANVPSLLALPFNGYVAANDTVYQATRALLLSNRTNPYFYGCGHPTDGCAFLGGIGSEDASGSAGLGRVWPLSLCTRLLTVDGDGVAADQERLAILRTLRMASGGTGLMHESYWFQNASVYTRFWFAMANSYLGEALLQLAEQRPHLLFTSV